MQYDKPLTPVEVGNLLDGNKNISEDTRQAIEKVTGTAPGGGKTEVNTGVFDGTTVTTPTDGEKVDLLIIKPAESEVPGAPVKIELPPELLASTKAFVFDTAADIEVNFDNVEAVIVTGDGNNAITATGNSSATIEAGAGNDTLITGNGGDVISAGAGNNVIDAGLGSDTVISGVGNDTIDAGEGHDAVSFVGAKADFKLNVVDGKVVVEGVANNSTSDLSNVEFITFANGETVVVAKTNEEAAAARLYKALLGRDADKDGAEYWSEQSTSGAVSLEAIANAFIESTENSAKGTLSDAEFIAALYQNGLDRAADAEGMAYWLNDLANGQTRANIAINIVGSEEAGVVIDNVINVGNM